MFEAVPAWNSGRRAAKFLKMGGLNLPTSAIKPVTIALPGSVVFTSPGRAPHGARLKEARSLLGRRQYRGSFLALRKTFSTSGSCIFLVANSPFKISIESVPILPIKFGLGL